jgi:hypothetical protein
MSRFHALNLKRDFVLFPGIMNAGKDLTATPLASRLAGAEARCVGDLVSNVDNDVD